MELAGRILAFLPALLALYAALRLTLRLRHQQALGGLGLVLLALQSPVSLVSYLAVLQTGMSGLVLAGLIVGGGAAGVAAGALMRVVRVGRRRRVRRAGWLPVPTALAVVGVQTAAVFGDLDVLRIALGALAATTGLGIGATGAALVLLVIRHPVPTEPAIGLAPPPSAAEVAARHARTEPVRRSVRAPVAPPPVAPPPAPSYSPAPPQAYPPAPPQAYPSAYPPAPPPVPPPAPRRPSGRRWLAAIATVLVVAAALAGTWWAISDRGTQPTGEETITSGAVGWRFSNGTVDLMPPVVVDGVVLIGDVNGRLHGIDLVTGQKLWTRAFAADAPAIPAAVGIDAYVVNGSALIALDAVTGVERWRVNLDAFNAFASAPAPAGGLVVTATDLAVYGIDPSTGEVVWTTRSGSRGLFTSSPTVAGTRVLIARPRGLTALDAGTGRTVWTFATVSGEGVWSAPAILGERAFLAIGARLVALDLVTGRTLWSFDGPGGDQLNETPAVSSDRVYVTDGRVYALDAATGARLWVSGAVDPASSPAVSSTPVLAGSLLLIPAADGLYALHSENGGLAWRLAVTETLGVGVPAASARDVVVVSVAMDRSVAHGIDPETGAERWSLELASEAHFTAPVAAGGYVLIVGRNDLIAVE